MPYSTGNWGQQAKKRSKQRAQYFKDYHKNPELARKHTLGELGEELASHLFRLPRVNQPGYDLKGLLKIEVKSATPGKDGKWTFAISKDQLKEAEVYIFYCFNKEMMMQRVFLLPNYLITKTSLSISEDSTKFDGFRLF